jgi:transposase
LGISQAEAAEKLGIPKGSLGNWVMNAKRRGHDRVLPGEPTMQELKAEVTRLRKELPRAEMEREIVKKAAAYFAKESLQDAVCKVLKVSHSGYRAWQDRPISDSNASRPDKSCATYTERPTCCRNEHICGVMFLKRRFGDTFD